jgi:hypothetical protein
MFSFALCHHTLSAAAGLNVAVNKGWIAGVARGLADSQSAAEGHLVCEQNKNIICRIKAA